MQQQPAETAQGRFDASLYNRFAATVFTYVLSQVQNEQDAQELLRLRYCDGLRFYEIATMLEKPEGTVRKLMVRTLRQLRHIYDRLEGGMLR